MNAYCCQGKTLKQWNFRQSQQTSTNGAMHRQFTGGSSNAGEMYVRGIYFPLDKNKK